MPPPPAHGGLLGQRQDGDRVRPSGVEPPDGRCAAGKIQCIVVRDLSRFGRDYVETGNYLEKIFPALGTRFISVKENFDNFTCGNAMESLSVSLQNLVNAMYSRDISKKVSTALRAQMETGRFRNRNLPYGYLWNGDKTAYVVDEEAAAVVREVFTLFSQGYGKTAIARMLNDRGIPNPTEYKRLHGLLYKQPTGKNSILWKYSAISHMLINEIYIGNMVQGKYGSVSYKTKQNKPRPKDEWYRVEGTHEPIIDRELWDRVQSMISEKAKPFTVGTIGLFARKARCMYCGYTMRSSKTADGRHYLQCSNRHAAKDACTGSFISVKRLEQAVITELNQLSQEYLDMDQLEQNVEFCSNIREKKTSLETQLASYQKRIDENTTIIRELYLDKAKGVLSEREFLDLSKDFTNDRERLERLIGETQKQLRVIEKKIRTGDDHRQLLKQYTNPEYLDREIVETMIDFILVGKRIPGTKNIPIEIHWNF